MDSLDEFLSIYESEVDDDTGSENDINELPSMPPPPEDQSFNTMQEAMDCINNFTKSHGYALTTKHSKSKDGVIVVKYLQCDRGGTYRSRINENRRRRQGSSRLNGCPFRAVLRYREEFDAWHLRVDNPRHNHEPSPVSTHPTLRRQELNANSPQIETQLQQGVSTRQIIRGLRHTNDGASGLKPQDIYNLRKDLRRKFLEGRTPIQALITQLPEDGDWIFNYEVDEDNAIRTLFCSHRTSLENLRLNPYVLFMDCTYKTNRYRMPLLDIVGSTACNGTFYVAFAFLSTEKQESYDFVLNNLANVYRQLTLPPPKTILTDKDKALLKSINEIFPRTDSMLCHWHINKNLLTKARPIIRKETARTLAGDNIANQRQLLVANAKEFQNQVEEKWKEMLDFWTKVITAETIEEKDQNWNRFKHEYNSEVFREIVEYLKEEWLEDETARKFLHCYTKFYKHFGNSATSRAEGGHWMLKKDLGVSTNDLLTAIQSFERTIPNLPA